MVAISYILPNYNHGHYLPEALDSVLRQSVDSMEIVVVDDASSDNSIEIIKEYQSKYSQIKLIVHEKNQGPVTALNRGIKESVGEYIALGAADDKVLPGFFQESTDLLNQFPNAGLCTTNFCYFYDGESKEHVKASILNVKEPCVFTVNEVVNLIKKYNFWIPGNGSVLRKSCIVECGLLKEDLKSLCDWFLCLAIAFRYGVCYIPKALTAFRMSVNSYSLRSPQHKLYDALFQRLDSPEYSDIKELFLKSGIFFQLDKAIFPYLFKKKGCKKYVFSIFMQKFRQKMHNLREQ
ncbi:MAG: glycosyltransferase [Chlamydiales bacterium]|nr:glycosyltransferase [Chlamydiales bacterium]